MYNLTYFWTGFQPIPSHRLPKPLELVKHLWHQAGAPNGGTKRGHQTGAPRGGTTRGHQAGVPSGGRQAGHQAGAPNGRRAQPGPASCTNQAGALVIIGDQSGAPSGGTIGEHQAGAPSGIVSSFSCRLPQLGPCPASCLVAYLFSLRVFRLGLLRTRGCEEQWRYPEVCRLAAPGLPFTWGAGLLGRLWFSGSWGGPGEPSC